MRALLAKAESTEFEAEAQALTAKAQDLMTRYALTRAVVDEVDESAGGPEFREVVIEAPYVSAKGCLFGAVASANRCRVVWSADDARGSVFGYPADLDTVDLLFTSLLLQVTAAVARTGPVRDAYGVSRTRSYRRSFILGFAARVRERLRAATRATTEEVASDGDGSLLPILADRAERVGALVQRTFPDLETRTHRVSNGLGYSAGVEAGARATITTPSTIPCRPGTAVGPGGA